MYNINIQHAKLNDYKSNRVMHRFKLQVSYIRDNCNVRQRSSYTSPQFCKWRSRRVRELELERNPCFQFSEQEDGTEELENLEYITTIINVRNPADSLMQME